MEVTGLELGLWRCGVSDLGGTAQRDIRRSREAFAPGTDGTARAEKGAWPPASAARGLRRSCETARPGGSTQSVLVQMPESPHKAVFSGCQVIHGIWESLKKLKGRDLLGPRPPYMKA